MARTVVTKPLRRMTQAELDQFLEKAADILRGNVDHSEFRGYVFALLFFKRISDVYQEEVRKLTAELGDKSLALDPRMHNFVVPKDCLWEDVAHTSRNKLGTALNEAMIAIERANQPKFDGILTGGIDFNDAEKLPRDKLINLITHFGKQTFDKAHVTDDIFGDAYEYLIRNFASKAGKSSGEFYTPREVAYLMSEIVEPEPGHHVCDWASGSGGLLLQCRNRVRRHSGEPDRLFLYGQESNLATYNISRINMILHGVKGWQHRHGDSLRNPRHLDDGNKLLQFDRIIMNPPFSLKDWGYDDFLGGDPYGRLSYGMPPRDNGDYAWLQHVVKSLKTDGRAIVVMSQGVLFRGQPEQTEEENGQNQKADAEYVIREGFINSDLIECVVVLPSKLFYGNTVPACLVVLNKNKPVERVGKILMIWGSRHFMSANPQNILRPSDLMRILVPWRAYGDLEKAKELIGEHAAALMDEVEQQKNRRTKDIDEAYAPLLEPLPELRTELTRLAETDWDSWSRSPSTHHQFFGSLLPLQKEIADLESRLDSSTDNETMAIRNRLKIAKVEIRTRVADAKKGYKARMKELNRIIRELEKMVLSERERARTEIIESANREIAHIRESAAHLLSICQDAREAERYFVIAHKHEIEANEFNLNLPRYVDTFAPEPDIPLESAIRDFQAVVERKAHLRAEMSESFGLINIVEEAE